MGQIGLFLVDSLILSAPPVELAREGTVLANTPPVPHPVQSKRKQIFYGHNPVISCQEFNKYLESPGWPKSQLTKTKPTRLT